MPYGYLVRSELFSESCGIILSESVLSDCKRDCLILYKKGSYARYASVEIL